jgi:hypothetical protein
MNWRCEDSKKASKVGGDVGSTVSGSFGSRNTVAQMVRCEFGFRFARSPAERSYHDWVSILEDYGLLAFFPRIWENVLVRELCTPGTAHAIGRLLVYTASVLVRYENVRPENGS